MEKNEAQNRISVLRDLLAEYNRRYYVENDPLVSDFEFDALMREYNRRQADNYRRQAQCIDKIHKEIPQIKLIEEEIRSASVEQAAARKFA